MKTNQVIIVHTERMKAEKHCVVSCFIKKLLIDWKQQQQQNNQSLDDQRVKEKHYEIFEMPDSCNHIGCGKN